MADTYTWEDTLKVGQVGEDIAVGYLVGRGCFVTNVRNEPEYQKRGIDLLVLQPSGSEVAVEVKTDRHTTGNVYLEVVSNLNKGTDGCIWASQADYLWYYFIKTGGVVIIPVKPLQDWMKTRLKDFIPVSPGSGQGAAVFRSLGYAVPKDTLIKEVEGCFEIDLFDGGVS